MKNYFEEIGAWPRSHNIAGSYAVGFALSLMLTFAAYEFVVQNALPHGWLVAVVVGAAILQFIVQVYCFLHIGTDSSTRERLFALSFAGLLMLILVSGSLWIMFDLNGRMRPDSTQMVQYMNDQGGF
ncbi:MAG: cytochrome o ubiquinol oxidase subunit IV [Candidatus Pacebacteria bacterium]|nr:cytochrome o ubiquinol oxidase subunit IV [Candidatus Paceibacterota bacterium]